MVNQIGDFAFLTLRGQPETVRQQLELIVRPGVAGVGLWKRGMIPTPFHLRSAVDAPDKEAARSFYKLYCRLIGANPVSLVWSDLDLTSGEGYGFSVLKVIPVLITALANSSGGLNPPSLGWIECDWELVPIVA
jgi:hypothetical protein